MNDDLFVTLYVYGWCGYSTLAKDLCKQHKLKHRTHDLDKYNGKEEVIKSLKKIGKIPMNSNHRTAPIVFVNGKFIGGCEELRNFIKKL